MNNIQEMDWAEDCWHGHTGMDSSCDYCAVDEEDKKKSPTEPEGDKKGTSDK
ncbi:MAG: hypothetical protein AB7F61_03690 [Desulfobulbus sp.]